MNNNITTQVLKVNPRALEVEKLNTAAQMLKKGYLVAFPTETVYGLGVVWKDKAALKRLIAVKKRPRYKPFTVHIADFSHFDRLLPRTEKLAREIARRFWPGPLTIIVKVRNGAKIGVRMPDEKIARHIIRKAGGYVLLPSANISGRRPSKTAKEVIKYLAGYIDIIVDGGRCRLGTESTVLDLTKASPEILREGAIGKEVRKFFSKRGK